MDVALGNIEEFVLKILSRQDVLKHNKDAAISNMNRTFKEFQIGNEVAFNETLNLLDINTQELVDIIRDSLTDAKNISTLLAYREVFSKEDKTISDKLKFIAVCYEIASLFKLGSYILSKGKAPIRSLKSPQKIFKGYKAIGIDFNVDKIREIRNAINHRFVIKGDMIIDKDDKEIITVTGLEEIYEKLEKCVRWYLNFLAFHSYYIPKFGVILINTIYYQVSENKEEYKSYYDGFKLIAPRFSNRKKVKKEEKIVFDNSITGIVNRAKSSLKEMFTIRFTTKVYLSKNRLNNKPLYRQNISNIELQLSRQIGVICNHLKNLKENLKNENDKSRVDKTIDWLNERKPIWIDKLKRQRMKVK